MTKVEKKKILIIHGWLHSAERYSSLAERLSEFANVDVYEFEGFGKTKFKYKTLNILDYYVEQLDKYLQVRKYDIVITHSMGGNIVLKVLSKSKHKIKNVILSNTAYQGIPVLKPIAWMLPINILSLLIIKIVPKMLIKPIMRKISLLTIQDSTYFDEIMFNDALRCNAIVAATTLFQLAFDRFKFIHGNQHDEIKFIVTYSEKDRVIPLSNTKKLINDLGDSFVKEYKNIGHTVVLEAEEEYYQVIIKLIDKGV